MYPRTTNIPDECHDPRASTDHHLTPQARQNNSGAAIISRARHSSQPCRHTPKCKTNPRVPARTAQTPESAIHSLTLEFEKLIDPRGTCFVCSEKRNSSFFPKRATSSCFHESDSCILCLRKWLRTAAIDGGLKCRMSIHLPILRHQRTCQRSYVYKVKDHMTTCLTMLEVILC